MNSLPPRQRQILDLILSGKTKRTDIAKALGIKPSTAKCHLAGLYRHFGVKRKGQLIPVVWARLENGQADYG